MKKVVQIKELLNEEETSNFTMKKNIISMRFKR